VSQRLRTTVPRNLGNAKSFFRYDTCFKNPNPPDKRLLVVCNSGVRSFEARRQLETAGLCNAINLQGGLPALKKSGALDLKDSEEPAKD